MPRFRQILRASTLEISVWRGTASVAPVAGFVHNECAAPLSSARTRACAGAEAAHFVSLQDDNASFGIVGHAAQAVFPAVFENQGDSLRETVARFVLSKALAVGSGDFGAKRNDPVAITFEHRRELVMHMQFYAYDSAERGQCLTAFSFEFWLMASVAESANRLNNLRTNFVFLERHDVQLVRLEMLAEQHWPGPSAENLCHRIRMMNPPRNFSRAFGVDPSCLQLIQNEGRETGNANPKRQTPKIAVERSYNTYRFTISAARYNSSADCKVIFRRRSG